MKKAERLSPKSWQTLNKQRKVLLAEQMDTALLSVSLDSEEYERKAEFLSILHQYVEGNVHNLPGKEEGC